MSDVGSQLVVYRNPAIAIANRGLVESDSVDIGARIGSRIGAGDLSRPAEPSAAQSGAGADGTARHHAVFRGRGRAGRGVPVPERAETDPDFKQSG